MRDRTVNHPMPRTVLLVLRPLAVALASSESCDRLHPNTVFHLIDLFLFPSEQLDTFNQEHSLMSLGSLTLHSSKVSQAGHCMPASLRSLADRSSKTQDLLPRACIADLLLPSFMHVINPNDLALRRGGTLQFEFHVLHLDKDVKGRLLLLAAFLPLVS